MRRVLLFPVMIFVFLTAVAAQAADSGPHDRVLVLAAASLTDVIGELAKAYSADHDVQVDSSFASSSALARQIEAQAPADIFISADLEWMDYLATRMLLRPGSRRNLLGNSLVLIAPVTSGVQVRIAPRLDLLTALGSDGKLAVADPDSVPAGKYARESLQKLEAWQSVEPRLVRAENVRAALAFVARGEAPLGIVYATDAKAEPRVRVVATFPADSHAPIVYPVALTRSARPAAQGFLTFLQSPEARDRFERAGFRVVR